MTNNNTGQLLLFSTNGPVRTSTTFAMSHEHVVQAIDFYLRAHNLWPYPDHILIDADLGIELNDDGLVEVDVLLEREID